MGFLDPVHGPRSLDRGGIATITTLILLVLTVSSADGYQLPRHAFSNSATRASNGTSSLVGAAGESGVVGRFEGFGYRLSSGFWAATGERATSDIEDVSGAQANLQNRLGRNYPNPFGDKTSIRFSLSQAAAVKLRVFDIAGREVSTLVHGPYPAGAHRILWDGRDDSGAPVPLGLYFYRVQIGPWSMTRKMLKIH